MRKRNRDPEADRDRVISLAEHAACKGREVLFTSDARGINRGALRAMQAICASCPVLDLCAQYAEQINPTCGVWAGKVYTTDWQRSK